MTTRPIVAATSRHRSETRRPRSVPYSRSTHYGSLTSLPILGRSGMFGQGLFNSDAPSYKRGIGRGNWQFFDMTAHTPSQKTVSKKLLRSEVQPIAASGELDFPRHRWDLSPKEAVQLQKQLCEQIRIDLSVPKIQRVGGVDVGYSRQSKQSIASVVVLSYPELVVVESSVARLPTPFPYVPGLLSFREVPVILRALESLSSLPDLIFVDGHGRAHPRRLGIASHLGWWLQAATIGIGKSRLCGEYTLESSERGSRVDLVHKNELIGQVLHTRSGVRPIFVSVGYGVPLEECVRWTLLVSPRYRIPEPIRQAHQLAANHV